MIRKYGIAVILILVLLLAAACGNNNDKDALGNLPVVDEPSHKEENIPNEPVQVEPDDETLEPTDPADSTQDEHTDQETDNKPNTDHNQSEAVVADPEAITVLVNKTYALPKNYEPEDLVEVNVSFTFKEKDNPRRKMRKEAAAALESLFAGATDDGIGLLAVSGYRPYALQKVLFDNYVKKDGLEAASRYSAKPGHSEHSTGLAMDVTGSDGKCAASDCFGGTPAAVWLHEHTHEYGFIIRYPEGKEDITGYKYEPWHLRYIGIELATELHEKELTLEEYYADAVPVTN